MANFGFKLTEQELRYQVDNYKTLPITKSYKGISTLLLSFSVVVTAALIKFAGWNSMAIFDLVVLAILALFVYRGNSWAMIAAIIMWTAEKGYQVVATPTYIVVALIWWYIYVNVFYKAYQVEKARTRIPMPGPPEGSNANMSEVKSQ